MVPDPIRVGENANWVQTASATLREELVYRLRKVLVHVKAITNWQLDTEVIHVLAPELRTPNNSAKHCRNGNAPSHPYWNIPILHRLSNSYRSALWAD